MTRIRWPALLLILALHAALVASWTVQRQRAAAQHGERVAIQWLLPMPPLTVAQHAAPAPKALPGRLPAPASAPKVVAPPAAAPQAITSPAIQPPQPAATPADDPFAMPKPSVTDVVRQAKLDVGKIDRELRKEGQVPDPYKPGDSVQARLERAFDAAHEAVPPKWYQGAKITEIQQPSGAGNSNAAHTRVYKIQTALVTYCITIREDGQKSYTNCPR